ncbi:MULTISPECIES: CDP-alcohol phosphatidyltransferase family protein [Actinomycetes]|uniref:CDP-diacylglycerol--glycerol-3-phosphate 3-phosphatidyltransferase n=1 Tax=Agrococcus baldri TaxID=153730 RepID=A0AA94L0W3_9MICO|nr:MULTISPECIES: CDP-alcohol phosphatidyltransferase family protein [Actinomycetes]MCQ9386993.1 CDP-alcohol phosphatidyltransferase family protein [Brevibacterium sp. 68QC2CO]MCQ9387636.1 CDP-alcohol phosphatidyltransferase family protein [Brevibacterium sp. 50QC2O2]SFS19351.1 CDP-diacylglycerol--glycerol-3-phosphate 3-phosphatidyltransferase [Agrococcus baldri]
MNRTTDSKRPRDWATIPNAVTLLRFALVAPVAVLLVDGSRPVLAVVLLAIFGASDWVDGALARKLGQTSKTGAVLDPVADRIGVAVIALALVMAGHVSIWVALGIAAVDVALGVTYLMVRPSHAPEVSWIGKIRTAVLMAGILLVGLGAIPNLHLFGVAGQAFCVIGAALHLLAGIGYLSSIMCGPRKA